MDPNKPIEQAKEQKSRRASNLRGNDVSRATDTFFMIHPDINTIEKSVVSFFEDNLKLKDTSGQLCTITYSNSQRAKSNTQGDGQRRDQKGRLQLPILAIDCNSIGKRQGLFVPQNVNYSISPKREKYVYDRFTALNDIKSPKEIYHVRMPRYITLSFSARIKAKYRRDINKMIEAIQYADFEYWGEENGYKFFVDTQNFNINNVVGENEEKVSSTDFSMEVQAYILPEEYKDESTIKKSFSKVRVTVGAESVKSLDDIL